MSDTRFSAPPGFAWGYFSAPSGADIRYGHAAAINSHGAAVILPGFREPGEKYFELMHDMLSRGFDVWIMEWLGQGGSSRYLPGDPMRSHHTGFDEQIDILHIFMTKTVQPAGPVFMLAHSMGGHLGLRYMHAHPGIFAAAVMSAPMVNIYTLPLPLIAARALAAFGQRVGWTERYAPGCGPWRREQDVFATNKLTSDEERFHVQTNTYTNNPFLQMGGPTWGWVYHAFRSIDRLQDENVLKSIDTPVLMATAGRDRIVSNAAQKRAAALLPACKQLDIPEAKHEIWMERDALRGRLMKAMDSFFAEHLPHAIRKKHGKEHSA